MEDSVNDIIIKATIAINRVESRLGQEAKDSQII